MTTFYDKRSAWSPGPGRRQRNEFAEALFLAEVARAAEKRTRRPAETLPQLRQCLSRTARPVMSAAELERRTDVVMARLERRPDWRALVARLQANPLAAATMDARQSTAAERHAEQDRLLAGLREWTRGR